MASFSVVNNIASANAQANLQVSSIGLHTTLNRLSSGLRINYSGDDAAGLAVANAYRSEIAILNQGIRNANDGLSSLQIKDGALNNVSNLMDRMATLATQAASDGFAGDHAILDQEFQALVGEISREVGLAGLDVAVDFSVFLSDGSTVDGTIAAADTTTLGIDTLEVTDTTTAAAAVTAIGSAIAALGTVQGAVGTLENQLQYAISLAQSQVVNTQAAESRIRDANIAQESSNLARYNILNQSGIAALAQANASSSAVLALLR